MIYLDHNATAPLRPEVQAAMAPWWGTPANPASAHRAGQRARAAVEAARVSVAALIGADPRGVVFTSGATEATHAWFHGLVVQGVRHVAVGAIEHPCVHAAAARIVAAGGRVDRLPAGRDGRTHLALAPGVQALSLMAANHETGVVQPVDEARATGLRLHVDATQAAGRVPLSLGGVGAVVLSSHKLGGPGGVGALVLPDGEPFPALLGGGGQERGRRGGTVFTAGVVGFGAACRLAADRLADAPRIGALSDRIRTLVVHAGGRVVGRDLLPNTTCAVFPGIRGEAVVQALDLRGICVSAGAACASGSLSDSPVLTAMGDPEPGGAVRFSLGPDNSAADVDALAAALPEVLRAIRSAAALDLG